MCNETIRMYCYKISLGYKVILVLQPKLSLKTRFNNYDLAHEGSDTSWNLVQHAWNPKWNLEPCLGIWNPALRINLIISPGYFRISRHRVPTTFSARII